MSHACPDLLQEAVYGLPELNRESIRSARLVANPGCYPTAVTLGFLPLLEAGLVDPGWLVADAKSGGQRRGAQGERRDPDGGNGRELQGLFRGRPPSLTGDFPEPCHFCGWGLQLTFVPHLVPMIRGIEGDLVRAPQRFRCRLAVPVRGAFCGRAVRRCPAGRAHPETRSVRGSNHCLDRRNRAIGSRHRRRAIGHRQSRQGGRPGRPYRI